MVGGGSRRDDGPLNISSTNGFAVLESLKKKKKSDKESSKNKGSSKNQAKEQEPQVLWAPAPLNSKSWADVDDEDDDDYYATTAPLQAVWGSSEPNKTKEIEDVMEEESESEDEGLDEGGDDVEEEEPEAEPEVLIPAEPVEKKLPPSSSAPKDTERQLSKKELKKKGLEELDALLAELGISGKDNNAGQEELNEEKKLEGQNGDGGKKENAPAPSESKASKKKKAKKEKSSKEAKDSQEQQQPDGGDNNSGPDEVMGKHAEDTSTIDVKERLKKVVSLKKKKSNKEMDAAAKAAAIEAAARSARLSAAKKKEKNHYNQQPIR